MARCLIYGSAILRKKKSIMYILVALLIGVLIYVLFRPPLQRSVAFQYRNHAIVDLTWLPTPISIFVLYHLADILWALAFAETVYVIKGSHTLGALIALVSTALFETMQYFGVFAGTGDIWDVIFVAISLFGYWAIKGRRGVRNENKI